MDTIEKIGNKCTACRACEQSCPKNAITMKENKEGFLYPVIDREKCIECGICLKRCHANRKRVNTEQKAYIAVKPKNRENACKSTSGGIAHIISKIVIDKKRNYIWVNNG